MKPLQIKEGSVLTRKHLLEYIHDKNDKVHGVLQRLAIDVFADFMKGKDYSDTIIIDLGSYNRRFFPKVINIDMFDEGETDIVTDITKPLPIESNSVDFVACTTVLEHVSNPQFVVDEIFRVLRPGGVVWSDIPFMQPYHASPDDYQRFTITGIRHLFRKFEIVNSGAGYPNGFAVKWILECFRDTSHINGDLPSPSLPTIEKLFSQEFFTKLSEELSKMDLALVDKYQKTFPDNMHTIGNALFVHWVKK